MLMICLIALLLAIPLTSYSAKNATSAPSGQNFVGGNVGVSTISATLFTRITAIALLYAAALSYSSASVSSLDAGLGLYSGLIHATTVTQSMEVFLLVSGALILLPWVSMQGSSKLSIKIVGAGQYGGYTAIPEYPMIIIFTTIGATFLLASADLVSLYLAIELQSFGVYILAAVYRDSESATAAGLKYFLLGALSSSLILLGSGLVYGYTGLTNLDSIYELTSVPSLSDYSSDQLVGGYKQGVVLGLMIITVGLLFKVAAAPFHYWAPDVYDGTPTIVTTWLTVMPKISLFVFMLELYRGTGMFGYDTAAYSLITSVIENHSNSIDYLPTNGVEPALANVGTNLLLVCAFLSLVIGTVVGLGQYRIKRLFAYSTISHVGFLLLALAISSEESVEAFLFYIVQYSLTNINAFFVLLAFGYIGAVHGPIGHNSTNAQFAGQPTNFPTNSLDYSSGKIGSTTGSAEGPAVDVQFISELRGQFRANPILGLSLAICLFSMAGVPPLVGFFAKYTVLYTAIHNGYTFMAVIAILSSVVSAVYYLRVIRVIHFDQNVHNTTTNGKVHQLETMDAGVHSTSNHTDTVSSVHSYVIATLTLFVVLFAANPNLLLNSTSIMALSLYTA